MRSVEEVKERLRRAEAEIKTLIWILRAILLHLQAVEIICEMIKEAEKRW